MFVLISVLDWYVAEPKKKTKQKPAKIQTEITFVSRLHDSNEDHALVFCHCVSLIGQSLEVYFLEIQAATLYNLCFLSL